MAFRKSLLDVILPFPKGVQSHDAWIGMVGFASGKYYFTNKCLQLYRLHTNNVSGVSSGHTSLLYKLSYRMKILIAIAARYRRIRSV